MEQNAVVRKFSPNNWTGIAPKINIPQLNCLDREGVDIRCLDSTDFVIGKQTNFNGPVTIINCTQVLRQQSLQNQFVIQDTVLSPTATTKVQKLAVEKTDDEKGSMVCSTWGVSGRISILISIGLLLSVGITAVVLLLKPVPDETLPDYTKLLPQLNCTLLSNQSCLFSHFPWEQRAPEQTQPLTPPVPYLIVAQTHDEYCYTVKGCIEEVEHFQNQTEITPCNFLIGGDGNAFSDLGWYQKPEIPEKAYRICMMGNFTDDYPTYPQILATEALIRYAVQNEFLDKDYVLVAANATSARDYLPTIYGIIKKWPRFVEQPFS